MNIRMTFTLTWRYAFSTGNRHRKANVGILAGIAAEWWHWSLSVTDEQSAMGFASSCTLDRIVPCTGFHAGGYYPDSRSWWNHRPYQSCQRSFHSVSFHRSTSSHPGYLIKKKHYHEIRAIHHLFGKAIINSLNFHILRWETSNGQPIDVGEYHRDKTRSQNRWQYPDNFSKAGRTATLAPFIAEATAEVCFLQSSRNLMHRHFLPILIGCLRWPEPRQSLSECTRRSIRGKSHKVTDALSEVFPKQKYDHGNKWTMLFIQRFCSKKHWCTSFCFPCSSSWEWISAIIRSTVIP